MELPKISELRHRVAILVKEDVPTEFNRSQKRVKIRDEVWGKLEAVGAGIFWGAKQIDSGVTHRIYVRAIPGRTRPQDLFGVTDFVVDGMLYRMRRIADLGGAERFTVIDCEQKGFCDVCQRQG